MIKTYRAFVSFDVKKYLQIDEYDRIKLIYFAFSFFFIIGSYSILRAVKPAIFLGFVGKEYIPIAKIIAVALLFPIMFLYSKLIDSVRRYQVAISVIAIYSILGIAFAFFFAHPVYGVKNTQCNAYRLLGWAFEFFMDFYQAIIVSSFWSFITSVSTPDFANKSYGIIVGVSRIGGIISAAGSFLLMEGLPTVGYYSIPILVLISSIFLFGAGVCLYRVVKLVPKSNLHGYEAAYKASWHKKHEHDKKGSSVLEGLILMIREPYVMGIFVLVCSFELINTIFDYRFDVLISISTNNDINAISKIMLIYTGMFQALGCVFALVGTTAFLNFIGIRLSVMVMPIITIFLGAFLYVYPSLTVIFVVMVIMRALQYGFNMPIREMLYIPTIKDIQFKSKAWIDSVGRTAAKSTGSTVNLLVGGGVQGVAVFCIISSVAVVWIFIAFLVGKKYFNTIQNNEVIGS